MKRIFDKFIWFITGTNHKNLTYKIVAFIGLLLRVGLLPLMAPNVFEVLATSIVSNAGFPQWAYEIIVRVLLLLVDMIGLSRIFYIVSFWTVGNAYSTGSNPAFGSISYTIFYIVYSIIPVLLLRFFNWWVIISVLVAYIIICLNYYLISKYDNLLPDNWIMRLILHILIFLCIAALLIILKIFIF